MTGCHQETFTTLLVLIKIKKAKEHQIQISFRINEYHNYFLFSLVVGMFARNSQTLSFGLAKIQTQVMKSQLEFCKLTRNQILYNLLNTRDKIGT